VANDDKPPRPVHAEAHPSFFVLSVLFVNLGQQFRVKEYGRGLLEGDTMRVGVSRRLDWIPFEPILESPCHDRIVS
jgi:hypothetical protein